MSSGYLTKLDTGVAVDKYLIHGNGGMILWVSGIDNLDSCGDTRLVHLKGDLEGHQAMVAVVMVAYASGKKVGLWSEGCSRIPFRGDLLLVRSLYIIGDGMIFIDIPVSRKFDE